MRNQPRSIRALSSRAIHVGGRERAEVTSVRLARARQSFELIILHSTFMLRWSEYYCAQPAPRIQHRSSAVWTLSRDPTDICERCRGN
jgi:hypothetical protein